MQRKELSQKEELKHLKNIKKQEILERLSKVQ